VKLGDKYITVPSDPFSAVDHTIVTVTNRKEGYVQYERLVYGGGRHKACPYRSVDSLDIDSFVCCYKDRFFDMEDLTK
jgi:hypothetical protein